MGLGEVVPPGYKAKERSWVMRCRGQWVLNALFLEPNVKNWVERKEVGRDLDVLPGAHGLKGLVTRLWGCWERWNFTKVGARENGYGGACCWEGYRKNSSLFFGSLLSGCCLVSSFAYCESHHGGLPCHGPQSNGLNQPRTDTLETAG